MGHLRDGEVAIDVYRTTDPPFPSMPSAFRFYLANTEGTGFVEVYYDVTPSNLLIGQMPFRIRITADADSINFQRYDSAGHDEDGPLSRLLAFGTETIGDHLRVVVIAVTPQHDRQPPLLHRLPEPADQ